MQQYFLPVQVIHILVNQPILVEKSKCRPLNMSCQEIIADQKHQIKSNILF